MPHTPCMTCNGNGYVQYGDGPQRDFGKCPKCKGSKIEYENPAPSRLITADEARKRLVGERQ